MIYLAFVAMHLVIDMIFMDEDLEEEILDDVLYPIASEVLCVFLVLFGGLWFERNQVEKDPSTATVNTTVYTNYYIFPRWRGMNTCGHIFGGLLDDF